MVEIIREDADARRGRYVARIPGVAGEAEMTFTRRGPGQVSADHTGVPDSMAGQGVGRALVLRMVEDARREGFRILPLCPFVLAQLRRHPDWAELFVTP